MVGVGAICLGVILGPLALGATFPWSRLGLEAVMALAILCWIASGKASRVAALLPIAVAGFFLLQVLPLPDSLLMRVAPLSGAAWKVANPTAWGTIAVDPGATATAIRRLLLGLGTIGAVVTFGRSPSLRLSMLASIAASCALVVALAYAIPSSPDDRIILGCVDLGGPIQFWKSPVHAPVQTAGFSEGDTVAAAGYSWREDSWIVGDRIGPYIVSNHFAGGVCLMLPVAIGLWLWCMQGRLPAIARGSAALGMAGCALVAVAVVAKSRAGTASLVLALSALVSLLATKPVVRRATAGITIAGIFAWLGIAAAMHGPLRGIEKRLPYDVQKHLVALTVDGRVLATQLAKRIFVASPAFGTGFGSYYGLSAYLDEREPPWFSAHNDYVQWLAETGLLGGGIAAMALVGLVTAGSRFYRSAKPPNRIRDCGCWAALIGIAAHSAFDWNLHVPANAFLACIVAGLALSSVSATSMGEQNTRVSNTASQTAWTIAACAVYLTCFAILFRDAWSDTVQRRMRDAVVAGALPGPPPVGSAKPDLQSLARAIAEGEIAARWDPANASVSLLLGKLSVLAAVACAEPGDDREACLTQAQHWLDRSQRQAAICRGMPQKNGPRRPALPARSKPED